MAKAVLNEHSPLKLSVLSFKVTSFNSRRILHVRPSRYEPRIISSCRLLFVKFIIDFTTSDEKYGQGHLPIFDPGLLY